MPGIRPTSLSEAVFSFGQDFSLALDEFLDEFYMAYPDRELMQTMISTPPALTGDMFKDAYVGAVGEHLARRWGLYIPDWTNDPGREGGNVPSFVPSLETLRPILLVESPYAFRRRNIFTSEEPLQRARWPRDVEVYEPIGFSRR